MYWTRNYRICAIAALCVVLTLTPVTLSIPTIPMPSSGENTINTFPYIITVLCVITNEFDVLSESQMFVNLGLNCSCSDIHTYLIILRSIHNHSTHI